jgi:hypothetical protein
MKWKRFKSLLTSILSSNGGEEETPQQAGMREYCTYAKLSYSKGLAPDAS